MAALNDLLSSDSMFNAQRSLLPRLEAALSYAFADLALSDDEAQFDRLRSSVLQVASPTDFPTTYGSENAAEYPGYSAVMTLTDRIATINGEADVNDIWFSRSFVLPAIAALAVLFDREVSATGDGRLTIYLARREASLFGYELLDLRAWGTMVTEDGAMGITTLSDSDMTELTAHLAAASYFFMRGGIGVSIASKYLLGEAGLATQTTKPRQKGHPGGRFIVL